jgi:hypothetical protein
MFGPGCQFHHNHAKALQAPGRLADGIVAGNPNNHSARRCLPGMANDSLAMPKQAGTVSRMPSISVGRS